MVRYYFKGSEFDSTKAKIVHSHSAFHSAFTNHMYSGIYDAEGNRVGLLTTSNFYRLEGAMKDVTTESTMRLPIGTFIMHVNFSTDTEYIRYPVKSISHHGPKQVTISIGPLVDPAIPRTLDVE
jgi:hypothetical protein